MHLKDSTQSALRRCGRSRCRAVWCAALPCRLKLPTHAASVSVAVSNVRALCATPVFAHPAIASVLRASYQSLRAVTELLPMPASRLLPDAGEAGSCRAVVVFVHLTLGFVFPMLVSAAMELRARQLHARQSREVIAGGGGGVVCGFVCGFVCDACWGWGGVVGLGVRGCCTMQEGEKGAACGPWLAQTDGRIAQGQARGMVEFRLPPASCCRSRAHHAPTPHPAKTNQTPTSHPHLQYWHYWHRQLRHRSGWRFVSWIASGRQLFHSWVGDLAAVLLVAAALWDISLALSGSDQDAALL